MGQKVNPIGFRLGTSRDWDSSWFARKSYGREVLEDIAIRSYLESVLEDAEVSRIRIEKAGDSINVILRAGRPGVIIGRRGQEVDSLRAELMRRLGKRNIEITVQEVKSPELDAVLVAKNIAAQLVKRVSYKKAMKRAADSMMRAGARGGKICCAGRLQGAEIARDEWVIVGSVPLHTLRADVDWALAEARTTYGVIGVQVWICRGDARRI